MTFDNSILTIVTFLPAVGALLLLLVPGRDEASANVVRWISLAVTTVTFVLSLMMWAAFDNTTAAFQFVVNMPWLGDSIGYRMGVDGISILFVVLSAFLLPLCVLASWGSVEHRIREYMIAFLVLETVMIGSFATLDLAMFYVFFEGSLLPMFLIIGIWGGKRRIQASYKFFFYTFTGSVLMLLAIMAMYWNAGTLDISQLLEHKFPSGMQTWLWLAFFASLAVKMPMWPFHRWLPEAHVEAPTAGSVILAAVLLKMGGYGFLRFSLPMFPEASAQFANFVFVLSIGAIIITSLIALVQDDIKKLIAYSSVAHMGFVTMGIFAGNQLGVQGAMFQMLSHSIWNMAPCTPSWLPAKMPMVTKTMGIFAGNQLGVQGAMFQMLSHGIVSGALFFGVGVIYDRMHTREISAYGGLVERMPKYAVAFMVFTMANVGLPGTSGFVGEFLTMIGVFQVNTWVGLFAAVGVILSASYALYLYRRVVFGALTKDSLKAITDLNWREALILGPLVVLTILFGFYPAPILDATKASVDALVAHYAEATGAPAPVAEEAPAAEAAH